jgi:NAD(P)H dehydrogenase (quinone)
MKESYSSSPGRQTMKYLVICTHPNPKSFNHGVKETVVEELRMGGTEVVVRDLYSLRFDPLLKEADFSAMLKGSALPDVKAEQEHVRAADVVVFVYPLWWAGMPAMLKGYIDRVFSEGFAYKITEDGITGLLGDKKVLILTTTGAPREMYEESGMFKSMAQTIDDGIFRFCGMEIIEHRYLTGIPYITDDERKKMLQDLKGFVREKLISN